MAEEGENQHKISQKRMKSEEIVAEGGEDRISALQDCLLLEILSRLPSTKYAIRTGTLSKRWKHVWTSVPILSFTSRDYDPFLEWPPKTNIMPDFFSLVDKTLTQCRQLNLQKFEVFSGYDIRFESQVHNWIRFAISRDVEELTLMFFNIDSVAEVLLDQLIFTGSCFRDLTLQGCKLNPSGPISWKNLRSLCIYDADVSEDVIENILSGSPLLETFELNCYGYRRIDITSKSVKKLVFSGYLDFNTFCGGNCIEINAPNILSLTIQNDLTLGKLSLLNVSSLVESNLDYVKNEHLNTTHKEEEEEMLKGFILNLSHVKELNIGGRCSKVVSRLEGKGFVFPSNVKFVKRYKWFVQRSKWSDCI